MGVLAGTIGAAAARISPPVSYGLKIAEVDALTLQVVTDAESFGPFLGKLDTPGTKADRAGDGASGPGPGRGGARELAASSV